MKSPSGAMILAIIGLLWSVLLLIRSMILEYASISLTISYAIIILIFICLIARINWARVFFLVVYGAILIMAYFITIMALLLQSYADVVVNILTRFPTSLDKTFYFLSLLYPVVFVYYFTRPSVKGMFTKKIIMTSQDEQYFRRTMVNNKIKSAEFILSLIAIIYGFCGIVYDSMAHFLIINKPNLYGYFYQPLNTMFGRILFLTFRVAIIYPLFIIGGILLLQHKEWGRRVLVLISGVTLIFMSLFPYYVWPTIFSKVIYYDTLVILLYVIPLVCNIIFFSRKNI